MFFFMDVKSLILYQSSAAEKNHRDVVFKSELERIRSGCIHCDLCVRECHFLSENGTPGDIAKSTEKNRGISLECNLCGLCSAVCPKQLKPDTMFLELRRSAYDLNDINLPRYKGLLAYEQKGSSKRYSLYHFPDNCRSVFFPGCTLPGIKPDQTLKAYRYLKNIKPDTGIILDCCHKPSHDLGNQTYFESAFYGMIHLLKQNHIDEIILACTSCYSVFKDYASGFSIRTVYEIMAEHGVEADHKKKETITIHDPCVVRFEPDIHNAVRRLVENQGFNIHEKKHTRNKTLCCGEGGAVSCINPKISETWTHTVKKEACDHPVVTYCAGCTGLLSGKPTAVHLFDLIFDSEKWAAGKIKHSKAPFTYLNRILLKRKIKKENQTAVSFERQLKQG